MESLESIRHYFAGLDPGYYVLLVAPFVLLLASVAVLPLVAHHFWEKNRNKALVSLTFGVPVAAFFVYQDWHTLAVTILDYGAFIALLGALFIISGGIYIRGSFAGRPITNTGFMLVGAVLANFVGTTGASMLLIRPVLRANQMRQRKVHIVIFFIFIVSNVGGLLTPLGDPPLFLGFLKGVAFHWTLRLWPQWLVAVGALAAIFHLVDRHQFGREPVGVKDSMVSQNIEVTSLSTGEVLPNPPLQRGEGGSLQESEGRRERFGIEGSENFVFLGMVVGLILFSGYVLFPIKGDLIFGEHPGAAISKIVQILGMMLLAFASYKLTPRMIHERNRFNFHPIIEVAVIFAGIFLAMVPAQLILETRGAELGVDQQWHYFWMTGVLSSFLDNAPTYLTFTSLAKGGLHLPGETLEGLVADPVGAGFLVAISVGAVLMGANTYIGNGPNFMVKSIAEQEGIRMPSFFSYMVWSGVVLLPLFAVITVLFFV